MYIRKSLEGLAYIDDYNDHHIYKEACKCGDFSLLK